MTKIEWTKRPGTIGESWNFLAGCNKVSPGCDSCWALAMSWRLQNMEKRPGRYDFVTARKPSTPTKPGALEWTGRVNLDYDALEAPYRWRKPRTVFVQSMGDLFHRDVPSDFILEAFRVMAETPEHTYLVLTKRAGGMQGFFQGETVLNILNGPWGWPLPNVWLMITAENQEQADKRIPLLLQTPAAVRWVSVEPMLGPVNTFKKWTSDRMWPISVDWVVIGCESGPNRRPMRLKWALDLIDQCDVAQVPVFCKQITQPDMSVSKDPSEWPTELRRREWPR